ncbi:hypothetical protein [Marinospirillum insulare]|uniref:Uncharacterized protein n=1 Tax=Marinospirillum insulare TaxID=217169 RepID=A0ABQ5ZU74_9GAMM|nr:hypothetical protein [Marinospirillum insulare]GLR62592.1 hypothetical protein GCM10007878_00270 [Marinospirillum insulare]
MLLKFFSLRLGLLLVLIAWVNLPMAAIQASLVPIWVGVSWLVYLTRIEVGATKRRVWLAQYLKSESFWQQKLQLGFLGKAWQLLLALFLSLFLLLQLLTAEAWVWWLLLFSLLLLAAVEWLAQRLLHNSAQATYFMVLVRRLSVFITTALLVGLMLLVRLQVSQPWLIGLNWTEALLMQLPMQGEEGVLSLLIRLSQTLDITWQWLLQNTLGNHDTSGWLGVFAWAGIFALQAAFCMAWVQLLTSVHFLFDRMSIDLKVKHEK